MVKYEGVLAQRLALRGKRRISVVLYEAMKELILDGRIPLNERINEKQLSQALNVSRTPLRQALDLLVSEHLLVYEANRGVRVINLTEERIEEIFALQCQLEALLFSEAMRKLTAEQLDVLLERFRLVKASEASLAVDSLQAMSQSFTQLITSFARTPILEHLLNELSGYWEYLGQVLEVDVRQLQVSLRSHILILHSLIHKDAELLTRLLKQQSQLKQFWTLQAFRQQVGAGEDGVDGGGGDGGRGVGGGRVVNGVGSASGLEASMVEAHETSDEEKVGIASPSPAMFLCKEASCPLYTAFQTMMTFPLGKSGSVACGNS